MELVSGDRRTRRQLIGRGRGGRRGRWAQQTIILTPTTDLVLSENLGDDERALCALTSSFLLRGARGQLAFLRLLQYFSHYFTLFVLFCHLAALAFIRFCFFFLPLFRAPLSLGILLISH